jgi:shikimate dehydrogenase
VREPKLAAVIGHPIHHSLSPRIFQFLSRHLRFPVQYVAIDVPPAQLGKCGRELAAIGLTGWNVTIPHKEKILRQLRKVAREARVIGAVNVVHNARGGLAGYNTDVIGIRETLREQRVAVRGKTAIVFGAGGAAKAVCYVLARQGAKEVWIVNRTLARAKKLCRKYNTLLGSRTRFRAAGLAGDWREAAPKATLFINATPLGMQGFPSNELLPKELLPKERRTDAFAFDLVYRPEHTVFLRTAQRRGMKNIGGLDMLIWQALGAWEIWFRPIPAKKRKRAKDALKRYLRKTLL